MPGPLISLAVPLLISSHCECTHGWIEPLLDRIASDDTVVAIPVIDIINTHTFEYQGDAEPRQRGIFTWDLTFTWDAYALSCSAL